MGLAGLWPGDRFLADGAPRMLEETEAAPSARGSFLGQTREPAPRRPVGLSGADGAGAAAAQSGQQRAAEAGNPARALTSPPFPISVSPLANGRGRPRDVQGRGCTSGAHIEGSPKLMAGFGGLQLHAPPQLLLYNGAGQRGPIPRPYPWSACGARSVTRRPFPQATANGEGSFLPATATHPHLGQGQILTSAPGEQPVGAPICSSSFSSLPPQAACHRGSPGAARVCYPPRLLPLQPENEIPGPPGPGSFDPPPPSRFQTSAPPTLHPPWPFGGQGKLPGALPVR